MSSPTISFYPSAKEGTAQKVEQTTIEDFLEDVRIGRWEDLAHKIRKELAALGEDSTKQDRSKIKLQAPIVTISGLFTHRNEESLQKHSGFIAMDFDAIDLGQFDKVRKRLSESEYIYALFTSISGNGLCGLVKIPAADHKSSFNALSGHFLYNHEIKVDKACKDVTRARFASWDPDLYLNADSKVFSEIIREPKHTHYNPPDWRQRYYTIDRIEKIVDQIVAKGVSIAEEYLDYVRLGFALAGEFGESGRYLFHGLCSVYGEYEYEQTEAKYTELLRSGDGRVSIGTFYYLCDQQNIDVKPNGWRSRVVVKGKVVEKILEWEPFWNTISQGTDTKPMPDKVTVNRALLGKFLAFHGFGWYELSSGQPQHVHNNEGKLKVVIPHNMEHFVFDFLDTLPSPLPFTDPKQNIKPIRVKNILLGHLYVNKSLLSSLPKVSINAHRCSEHLAYIYFENCVLDISKEGMRTIKYKDLDRPVWEHRIKAHKFTNEPIDKNSKKCDVWRFFEKVCFNPDPDQHKKRFRQFMTTIGYLIHSYKTKRKIWCPILSDQEISDGQPEGSTGKGIIIEALKHVRNVADIDGKFIDLRKDNHKWEEITEGVDIVAIDDLHSDFIYEDMHSTLSGPVMVNVKNIQRYTLAFEVAPKFLIATNYWPSLVGKTNERRFITIPVSDYFSNTESVEGFLGRAMYEQWDHSEWNKFYNFMAWCVKLYLRNDLYFFQDSIAQQKRFTMIDPKVVELIEMSEGEKKHLDAHPDLSAFKYNLMIPRVKLYNSYKSLFENDEKDLVKVERTFYNQIKAYCDTTDRKYVRHDGWTEGKKRTIGFFHSTTD